MQTDNSAESENQGKSGLKLWQFYSGKRSAEYTRNYFDSLEAQFKSLSSTLRSGGNDEAYSVAQAILEKYKAPASTPSWGELMQLDLSIIQLFNDHHLQLKVAELRQKVSSIPYSGRVEVLLPPDKFPDHKDLLRAEAIQLATRLWQIRKVRHEKELQLKILITSQTHVATGIFLLALCAILIDLSMGHFGYSFFPVIFAFGVAGAFVSVLRRLQQAINSDAEPSISMEFSALGNEGEKLWISLITGGVFSILLYFLFVSGAGNDLIGKTLLPTFCCTGKSNCPPALADSFLALSLPSTTGDFAKCVVWSFLAGFSEQLVPDVLDRLAKQKKQ